MRAERWNGAIRLTLSTAEGRELLWWLASKGAWTPTSRSYKPTEDQRSEASILFNVLHGMVYEKAEVVDGGDVG